MVQFLKHLSHATLCHPKLWQNNHYPIHSTQVQQSSKQQLQLPAAVWHRLNISWVLYCVFMAATNAYVAAYFSTDAWVDFKIWGYAFPLVFIVGQGALARADGAAILALVAKAAASLGIVKDGWNGFNILHTAAGRVGALGHLQDVVGGVHVADHRQAVRPERERRRAGLDESPGRGLERARAVLPGQMDAIAWVEQLAAQLGVPQRLREIGVPREALAKIAHKTMGERGLYFNPRQVLEAGEILDLLEQAY